MPTCDSVDKVEAGRKLSAQLAKTALGSGSEEVRRNTPNSGASANACGWPEGGGSSERCALYCWEGPVARCRTAGSSSSEVRESIDWRRWP